MKQSVLRASLAGVLAAMLVAVPQAADARRRPPPSTPPPPPPSNTDEWALIGLTPSIVSSANGGSGVSVILLDGYTDCRHTDLAGHCEANEIQGGRYRFYDNHGTHTAGIIAGTKTGVAPAARIVNYGVFDDRGYVATGSKLIDAWNAGKAKGGTIASMSFGCAHMALCFTAAEVRAMGSPSLPLLYVKAAGNDGTNLVNESIAVTHDEALAAMQRTILVGSIELSGSLSSYSNRPGEGCLLYSGATGCTSDLQWKYYFIVAPGSSIYSTLPGGAYGLMSGTSMATPVVAGAAALLESRWPSLKSNPEAVADILFTTATDLGAPGVDGVFGWGLLNVTGAFQAQGNVTLFSPTGVGTVVNGSSFSASPTFAMLPKALGAVSVYDRYNRDFALAETGAMGVRVAYDSIHRMLGRRLLGLGGQADWSSALFATRHAPLGIAGFGSFAEPVASAYLPDQSLRMGIDMPFKGGVAQIRMTGASSARLDFAYDPSMRPLSFFASTALLKSSLFGQALFNLGDHSRLAVYGTSNGPGAISASAPGEPLLLQGLGRNSTTRLALAGLPTETRQRGFGMGYWTKPDRHTVIGLNASYLVQDGGYYDMATSLPGLDGTARLLNLGAVASRTTGSWELSASGEVTHIRTSGASSELLQLTPSNIVSAELRLRKAGVAFNNGRLADSMSLALVMPPRAVSGTLRLDYMAPTEDRLGRQPVSYRYAISGLGADPVKIEAGYRLTSGDAWSLDLSGGVNLQQSDYAGRGEALASFHLGF